MTLHFKAFKHLASAAIAALLAACAAEVPAEYTRTSEQATISPDYSNLTIPCNIAPLNFRIDTEADDYVTHLYTRAQPEGITVGGRTLDIPVDRWHSLLASARGDSIFADIYMRSTDGWTRCPSIANAVADSIDGYISYRLIEPSYIGFETMAICQRSLSDFNEKNIFNSMALSQEEEGQCINCHSYQDYNRGGRMQMHVRVRNGGTVIATGDTLKKITLKTPQTISNGVYPSWHPTLPLIAYSVNTTTQSFHSKDLNKVEVQDSESDLVLYDVDNETVKFIANDSNELETFPYWHPDGRSLWYVSASVPAMSAEEMALYQSEHYKDFKYDIYRRTFDPVTRTFGEADTVFRASDFGRSATLPRPSPDGRYLMFTMGEFGTFHIWHRDSDLYLYDIEKREIRPMTELNSDDVESYHSWSSNGRWIIFSTRRDDGSYTRLYLAYFDADGRAHKPFALPQRTPDFDPSRNKSYNIPEFMAAPVEISKRSLVKTIETDPVNVSML